MKTFVKRKFLILLLLIIGTVVAAVCGSFAPASAVSVNDNYRFDKISVEINVNKDKTFEVCETLEVRFLNGGINTGIIRDIQRISTTVRVVDGAQKNGGAYIAGLSNVSVTFDGGDCKVTQSLYNNSEFYSIKMQNPAGYIDEGVHTFVLNYVYDMHDDKVRGFDDFTFDVLGYAMAFTNEFNAKVTFPDDADLSNVTFRTNDKMTWTPQTGEYGYVEGNVVYIKAFPQDENVGYTVQAILPDGYFNVQKTFYWYYVIFALIAFAGIIAVAVIIITHLPKKTIETVEFYPPEGMPVMRFASIWRMGAKRKDTSALILKWAGLGIITVTANGSRHCILKANINPEIEYKEGMELSQRLTLPAKKCFATESEELYFNTLFSGIGGDGFTFSTLQFTAHATYEQKRLLYKVAELLVLEGDTEHSVTYVSNFKYRTLVMFLSLVPTVATVIYFSILNASALPVLFLLFMVVGNLPILHFENMKMIIPIIFPIAFYGLTFGAFYFIFGLTAYDYCGLIYIAPIMWALGAFVLRFIIRDRRTPEVLSDYGKMRGFKTFLLKAELPRIQVLFDENPYYFADILPYCLIMGISDKVKKRFASLNYAVPDYIESGISVGAISSAMSRSCSAGAPRSSGGGGGHGGSSGGGGGGGGSRGC